MTVEWVPARSTPGTPDSGSAPTIRWLGQAGFELRCTSGVLVIDPYLSDSLAQKYAGTLFEHTRLHPPPVTADELRCDLVVCTHRHTDHMDAGTLTVMQRIDPDLYVAVPRAVSEHALGIGLDPRRLIEMRVGEQFSPIPGLTITPIPAAHEDLSINPHGDHRFLGVIIETDGVTLYHSGDCVPYDGLAETLAERRVDVALLPVNGRDAFRRRHGVPGNFFVDEAFALCDQAGIATLIGHHVGLFGFNTVAADQLDRAAQFDTSNVRWVRPGLGEWLTIEPQPGSGV